MDYSFCKFICYENTGTVTTTHFNFGSFWTFFLIVNHLNILYLLTQIKLQTRLLSAKKSTPLITQIKPFSTVTVLFFCTFCINNTTEFQIMNAEPMENEREFADYV